MNDNINSKKPTQPAEVIDTWVRLVMHHHRVTQTNVAAQLGVSNATLSNWLKGTSSPDPLVLLRLMVHGRESWMQLMAFQGLQAVCPEVFVDADMCAVAVDLQRLAEVSAEVLVAGQVVEVPWA